MRIPTILGLSLLAIALGLAIFLFQYYKNNVSSAKLSFQPKDIIISNITDQSATFSWQTDTPSKGSVKWGDSRYLKYEQRDERDGEISEKRITHFVTIKGLKPSTEYFFQVSVDDFYYPDIPAQFKTATSEASKNLAGSSFYQPIVGTVLTPNLEPIDEAIIYLDIPQASLISGYTKTAGNFLLGLTELRSENLSKEFKPNQREYATLLIVRGESQSELKISLPLVTQTLPPVILGQDLDLTDLTPPPSPSPLPHPFDLNKDGQVNTLDISIITKEFSKKDKNLEVDLNQDGKIDQKDVDEVKSYLEK